MQSGRKDVASVQTTRKTNSLVSIEFKFQVGLKSYAWPLFFVSTFPIFPPVKNTSNDYTLVSRIKPNSIDTRELDLGAWTGLDRTSSYRDIARQGSSARLQYII